MTLRSLKISFPVNDRDKTHVNREKLWNENLRKFKLIQTNNFINSDGFNNPEKLTSLKWSFVSVINDIGIGNFYKYLLFHLLCIIKE